MDAVTAAVSLMTEKALLERLDASARMMKRNEQTKQQMVEMITQSVSDGGRYSSGGVSPSAVTGTRLDVQA